jgi:RNA polymerase sigma-70 factor (ECF subfamily)
LINTCIDHFRKSSNREIYNLGKQTENISDRSSSGFDSLSYKEILQAIRELTPAYRTVFNLFVMEGLSHEEISKKLDISVGASKSNLFKARGKLKSILAQKAQWNKSHWEAATS